jgi:hypothetical protein
MCALAHDLSKEQDFPEKILLQRTSKTSELLSGAPIPRRLLQRSSKSTLEQFFPHVVSCDEIAPWKKACEKLRK